MAEDVPDKKSKLKAMLDFTRIHPGSTLKSDHILLTLEEKSRDMVLQTIAGEVDRIVDTVHFVTKKEAPLIKIADACAFAFRRYFAEQEYGRFWVEAMLGAPLIWEDWQSPFSQTVFSFNSRHASRNKWKLQPMLRPLVSWRGPRW